MQQAENKEAVKQAWFPLGNLVATRVVTPFLPISIIEKVSGTESSKRHLLHHFHNVYPGDTVYVFETTDRAGDINAAKWVRGYSTSEPVPADYLAASTSAGLSRLPESHIHTVVVPRSCVQVRRRLQRIETGADLPIERVESCETEKSAKTGKSTDGATIDAVGTGRTQHTDAQDACNVSAASDLSDLSYNDEVSSISSMTSSSSTASDAAGRQKRPQLPLAAFAADTIEDEVCLEMKILSKIIFSVYTENDLEFFGKLVKIFEELDQIRVNLCHNFLTRYEQKLTHKKAVMLFNRTAKLLASSGGRINKRSVDASGGALGATAAGAHVALRSRKFAEYLSSKLASSTAIMARDENSAEMFSAADPARVAQNQVLDALSPNYPLMIDRMPFLPERNSDFEAPQPSNLLIDFKEVSGSSGVVSRGYDGMSALMYLRTSKRRLTQAFSVSIGRGQAVFLDNLSAALYSDIPASVLDHGKIYLVAILTENIRLDGQTADTGGASAPVSAASAQQAERNRRPGAPMVIDHLREIRRGICAGAVDISRVFSRKKGHLTSGEAHRFVIKLFSSYMPASSTGGAQPRRGKDTLPADGTAAQTALGGSPNNPALFAAMNKKMAMSLALQNTGWGQLVDRIITGSDKGIAVNPRAETLVLSIKELREEAALDEAPAPTAESAGASTQVDALAQAGPLSFDQQFYTPLHRASTEVSSLSSGAATNALASVGILDFNPYEPVPELVYLRVSRFKDLGISFAAKTFLTVTCRASSPRMRFASGPNDASQPSWQFLTVAPGESLDEVVQISGIGKACAAKTDSLIFDVYANGFHIGSGKFLLRDGDRVYDTGLYQKQTQSVDIVGKGSSGIAALEVALQYVGTCYNMDPAAREVLSWRGAGGSAGAGAGAGAGGAADLPALMKRFRRCDSATMSRFFAQLLLELLAMLECAPDAGQGAVFESIVHMLDVTIARHNDQAVLFDRFFAEHRGGMPRVGERLLALLTVHFAGFAAHWDSTGRALCRTSVLVLRLADASLRRRADFAALGYRFVDAIAAFLASRKETFITDQLLVLKTLELYLDVLARSFQVAELASFAASWIGATGLRGLASLPDDSANALVNRRRGREHSVLITKLLFMRRLLHGFIMCQGTPASRQLLVVSCFKIAYRVLMNPTVDLECARLALGVLLAVPYAETGGAPDSGHAHAHSRTHAHANVLAPGTAIALFRSLPFLCRAFNRFHEHLAHSGALGRPKRMYTQLFPICYPFTRYTMDSIVTDEMFSEVLIELAVVFCSFVRVAHARADSIRRYAEDPGAFEAQSAIFAPLDEFLGAPGVVSLASPDALGETVTALRAMLSARYFPGTRWISLEALVVSGVGQAIELFGDMSLGSLVVPVLGNNLGTPSASSLGVASGTPSGDNLVSRDNLVSSRDNLTSSRDNLISSKDKLISPANSPALTAKLLACFLLSATARPVALEHLAEIPRKGCLKLTGDSRGPAAAFFEHLWDAIGLPAGDQDKQRFHVRRFGGMQSSLIEQQPADTAVDFLTFLFALCMQHNAKCKQVGLDAVWSIVASEIVAAENSAALQPTSDQQGDDLLFVLEQRSVTALYDLFESRPCGYVPRTADIRDFADGLREMLLERLDREDVARASVDRYVTTIGAYLDSFVGLGSIPDDPEFDDDRTFYKIRISGFLMDVDRPELFQSFVSQMYASNLDKGNHAQAALSLQLLADTYDWSIDAYIDASTRPNLPRQTVFKRKAELYVLIAKEFARAGKHVQAIEVYESLLDAYEKYNFDLDGLSACHGQLSRLYAEYQHVDRLDPTFFKVSFIGSGFPESFRSKQFIYEGLPYEHISSISGRLTRLYPGSRVVGNDEEAAKLLVLAQPPVGRYLHVKIVKPRGGSEIGGSGSGRSEIGGSGNAGSEKLSESENESETDETDETAETDETDESDCDSFATELTDSSSTIQTSHLSSMESSLAKQQTSQAAQQFSECKDLNTFVSSRRLPGSKSALTLWTEESTFTTCLTFPTLMNRSEIERTQTVRLSPIENAIRSLSQKQDELESIEMLIEQNLRDGASLKSIAASSMFDNLSRILAGSVDSPVNGGMGQYREFFARDNEQQLATANRQPLHRYRGLARGLRRRLHRLVALLCRLLKLHGMIVPAELHPQHQAMLELFAANFHGEIAHLHLDVFTPYDYHKLLRTLTVSSDTSGGTGSSLGGSRSRRRALFSPTGPAYGAASSFAASFARRRTRGSRRGHHGSTRPSAPSSAAASLNAASTAPYDPQYDPRSSRIGSASFYDDGPDQGLLPRGKRTVLNYR